MTKYFMVATLLLLAACSSSLGPPRNITNACAIAQDRPSWIRAARATERKWGVPAHVMLATMWRESRFVPDARTPRKYALWVIPVGRVSSAYGYAQAIDGTWSWYRQSTGNRFAQRDDFNDAADFIGWYMNQTRDKNGIALTDAYNQYLAYHEGHAGYKRGSYRSKRFLLNAASEVRNMAANYERQLESCT